MTVIFFSCRPQNLKFFSDEEDGKDNLGKFGLYRRGGGRKQIDG